MRRPSLLPDDQLAAVVSTLYGRADAEGWSNLGPSDRTRLYTGWVEDPAVGGILTRFMTPEQARAWIKDGPMKEYERASRGAGRYAAYGRSGGTTAGDVVRIALGGDAAVELGTERVKPFHCQARDSHGDLVFLAWGQSRSFKDLLWAALRAAALECIPAHIVVMESRDVVTTNDERERQQMLADRCDIRLHRMREVLGPRRGGGGL